VHVVPPRVRVQQKGPGLVARGLEAASIALHATDAARVADGIREPSLDTTSMPFDLRLDAILVA